MIRNFILIAAVLGFLGVALGAFGAHALDATLQANGRADTFDTANHYHLIHALAIIAAAWVESRTSSDNPTAKRWGRLAGWFFLAGEVLFSGSLYILAIFNLGFMGAVAPFGGFALLAGWASLGLAALNTEH